MEYFGDEVDFVNWRHNDDASFSTMGILLKTDYLIPVVRVLLTSGVLGLVNLEKL